MKTILEYYAQGQDFSYILGHLGLFRTFGNTFGLLLQNIDPIKRGEF